MKQLTNVYTHVQKILFMNQNLFWLANGCYYFFYHRSTQHTHCYLQKFRRKKSDLYFYNSLLYLLAVPSRRVQERKYSVWFYLTAHSNSIFSSRIGTEIYLNKFNFHILKPKLVNVHVFRFYIYAIPQKNITIWIMDMLS